MSVTGDLLYGPRTVLTAAGARRAMQAGDLQPGLDLLRAGRCTSELERELRAAVFDVAQGNEHTRETRAEEVRILDPLFDPTWQAIKAGRPASVEELTKELYSDRFGMAAALGIDQFGPLAWKWVVTTEAELRHADDAELARRLDPLIAAMPPRLEPTPLAKRVARWLVAPGAGEIWGREEASSARVWQDWAVALTWQFARKFGWDYVHDPDEAYDYPSDVVVAELAVEVQAGQGQLRQRAVEIGRKHALRWAYGHLEKQLGRESIEPFALIDDPVTAVNARARFRDADAHQVQVLLDAGLSVYDGQPRIDEAKAWRMVLEVFESGFFGARAEDGWQAVERELVLLFGLLPRDSQPW